MQVCCRCLYPSNHPLGITFDSEGVCSGCRVHEEKDNLDWRPRERSLAKILDGYRGLSRGKHDCIVPVTGARDSFFIVHVVRKVYGLNPLLVTYNRHYNTRAGTYNLARLRTALGCDIVTMTLNPSIVQRVMRATISRLGSFHWHAIAGQTVFPVQTAVQMKVPLIIWGAHQGIEQVGMFSHVDEVEMTRKYRREHDLMGLEAENMMGADDLSESDLAPFFYPQDADLRRVGVRGIYLGNYIRWDTKAQHESMVGLYDYYQGALDRTFDNYNDVDDMHYSGLHDVLKVRKLGYGSALDHASREIRYGRLAREDAQSLIEYYQGRSARSADALAAFAGLPISEIYKAADRARDWRLSEGAGALQALNSEQPAVCLPKSEIFQHNRPADLLGDPHAQQMLTRGYARE